MQENIDNKIICKNCGCINPMSNKFCANCGKSLAVNNHDDDHSIAMAVWGLVICWFVFVGFPLTLVAFIKGLIRKNVAAVIISSITLTIYCLAVVGIIYGFSQSNIRFPH